MTALSIAIFFVAANDLVELRPDHVVPSRQDGKLGIPLKFSKNGSQLFVSYCDYVAKVDLITGKHCYRVETELSALCCLSKDAQWMATITTDKILDADKPLPNEQLVVREANEGKQQCMLSGHEGGIYNCEFSSDGKLLFSVGTDGKIHVFRTNDGKEVRVASAHEKKIGCAAISPDSQMLATASCDQSIKLWNPITLKGIGNHKMDWSADFLRFSPNSRFLAAWRSSRSSIIIWDMQNKDRHYEIAKQHNPSAFIAFSNDGKTLLANHGNGIGIWDVESGKELEFLSGNRDDIVSASLSPTGRYLVSANADHTVKLWDMKLGTQCAILTTTNKNTRTLIFSPDGMKVAGGCTDDGQITIWSLPKGRFSTPK